MLNGSGKQIMLEEAKEINGAHGGDSEGDFWDFSRAFEVKHSCALLYLISLQNTESPLYLHLTTELISHDWAICARRGKMRENM